MGRIEAFEAYVYRLWFASLAILLMGSRPYKGYAAYISVNKPHFDGAVLSKVTSS